MLATKVHGTMGDDPNQFGNSRRWIVREVENSLRRLKTDHIDLYQIHRPEADTDIDETLGALTDLVRQGKVRYIGSSTFPASQIVEAQWVARDRGRERFVCEQPPYSMLARGIENDVLPTCRRHGMGVIPWSPLAGGWLSGKWRKGQDAPDSSRAQRMPARYDLSDPGNQRKLDAADALGALADEAGMTLIQMALAFVINHPAVTAAIIGPRTMEQLESQLGADEVTLDPALLDRIDEIVPPGIDAERRRRRLAEPGPQARGPPPLGGAGLEPGHGAGGAQALDDRVRDGERVDDVVARREPRAHAHDGPRAGGGELRIGAGDRAELAVERADRPVDQLVELIGVRCGG